jgi:3-hydroxybutyryl-CoA dehydratase
MEKVRIEDLEEGMSAEFTKTVTEADVVLFAGITGDLNPVHVDEMAARESRFEGRIAHGMLSAAFISTVLGTRLPGPGTVYMGQTLRFTAPVRIGDTVTARVTISELDRERRRAILETVCVNQDGETVIEGEAKVLV